jgi:succinyl-diaminopimelate desuccinylase
LDWIQEQLSELPLTFTSITHGGISNLVATTPAVKNHHQPKLWLAGHIDVVPGTPQEFTPVVKDGRLYGRGVFDMKYATAIYIDLLKKLGDDLAGYDLGLMLVSDEEVGGQHGAGHLTGLGYAGTAMLLPECGTSWSLETGGKGVTWWTATAAGHSGHAARPWNGTNAISRLTKFLTDLSVHFPTEPCHDPNHLHNTINIGTISGGAATNQIPGLAEATIDIRLMPNQSIDDMQTLLEHVANNTPGVKIERSMCDPAFTLPSDGPAELFEKITNEITGRKLGRTFAHASSDSRYFAAKGVQVITVPTTGGGQHSPEEWIDLADLDKYAQIIHRFVTEWAGPGAA